MNDTITLGSTVLLPDGSTATVTRNRPRVGASDDGTVEVTHADHTIGRGPWIFQRSQLRPVDTEPGAPAMAVRS